MFTRQKDSFISMTALISHTLKLISLSGIFMLAGMSAASAAEVNVTTEFIADLLQPQKNAFVNTTPVSGFCIRAPTYCGKGEFSILIPGLTAMKHLDTHSPDLVANHTSISIDGSVREVTLKNIETGEEITGRFRISLFGMQHNRIDPNSGHLYNAMTGTGVDPKGDCDAKTAGPGNAGDGGASAYYHGWGVPDMRATCYRKLNDTPQGQFKGDVTISDFSFGYTLDTPDPLNILTGEYEGQVIYTVGDGGNINFNALSTSDSEIKINIKATVRHAFQFFFAPGSENVQLAPKSGWSQWVNGGRVPESLNKEVPFTLSSSTGFTISMICTIPSGTGCGLRNDGTGEDIPLEVSLTLPGFKTKGGSDVRKLLLNSSPAGHDFVTSGIVTNRRSQVDFKVQKPGVERMVKYPGSTWKGGVTLVFDALTD